MIRQLLEKSDLRILKNPTIIRPIKFVKSDQNPTTNAEKSDQNPTNFDKRPNCGYNFYFFTSVVVKLKRHEQE